MIAVAEDTPSIINNTSPSLDLLNLIYVVTCNVWGGTSYNKEIVEAFFDKSLALAACKAYQGGVPKCDVEYEVASVEINSGSYIQ